MTKPKAEQAVNLDPVAPYGLTLKRLDDGSWQAYRFRLRGDEELIPIGRASTIESAYARMGRAQYLLFHPAGKQSRELLREFPDSIVRTPK